MAGAKPWGEPHHQHLPGELLLLCRMCRNVCRTWGFAWYCWLLRFKEALLNCKNCLLMLAVALSLEIQLPCKSFNIALADFVRDNKLQSPF